MGKALKRAWADTKAKHSWGSQFWISAIAGGLCWWLLPKDKAMDEIIAISIAVISALIIWPILEFMWNLCLAPIRLAHDRIYELETVVENIPSKLPPGRMPMLEFRDIAASQGWDFSSKHSLHILDFCDAIRQAALDPEIWLWGRPHRNQFEELDKMEPLNRIPTSHWKDFMIDSMSLVNAKDNFEIRSYDMGRTRKNGYVDIHIDDKYSLNWLESKAKEFMGRNKPRG